MSVGALLLFGLVDDRNHQKAARAQLRSRPVSCDGVATEDQTGLHARKRATYPNFTHFKAVPRENGDGAGATACRWWLVRFHRTFTVDLFLACVKNKPQ